jgi:hypothetical protein
MSTREKHVEEQVICDQCGRAITTGHWYRIYSNERQDFCSTPCAEKYRIEYFRIITHEKYPRIIGNTD